MKEVTFNSQENIPRTQYFCSNTAFPAKEAVFRHGTCTSVEYCLKVQLPSDPDNLAYKQVDRETPAKDRTKKANSLFQDLDFRSHSQSMRKKQQSFFKEVAPDLRWSCDYCAYKVNLPRAERVTRVDIAANEGQMHAHGCNNWMNSSSYMYAIRFNRWWLNETNIAVAKFLPESEDTALKKTKLHERMGEMGKGKGRATDLIVNAVANIPHTTIPVRVATVPMAKTLAHEMAFGSIQKHQGEWVPSFDLLEWFNQLLVVMSVFDEKLETQTLYPLPDRVKSERPTFKIIQDKWKQQHKESLATVVKSSYSLPAPLTQILDATPKQLALGEACHISALLMTAESALAKEAAAREDLNAEEKESGSGKEIGEVPNTYLICSICFQKMDEVCFEGDNCPRQANGRCPFEDMWSLNRTPTQWQQLFNMHIEKKGSVTVWPNDRALLHHVLIEHCRDATIDLVQQFTNHPLLDQEKCAFQLPFFNLAIILCDRPLIENRRIEILLLKCLKWIMEQVNPLRFEHEGELLQMHEVLDKMMVGSTGQSLLALVRFLEWEGQGLKHGDHHKHEALWRQERKQLTKELGGGGAGGDGAAAESAKKTDDLRMKVTGLRAYDTNFISAMQTKVEHAVLRRLGDDATSDKEGNSEKMCLNLVSSSFHMMQDALALPSKLPLQGNMEMQKGTLQEWPLLSKAGEEYKQKYLTNFMTSVQQLDAEILDWAGKMHLYYKL